jgi:hypothetical protein
MQHQPRVDPLITELTNLVSTEDGDVRDSVVNGLAATVTSGGKNMGESSASSVVDVISEAFAETPKGAFSLLPFSPLSSLTYLALYRVLRYRHRPSLRCHRHPQRRGSRIHHHFLHSRLRHRPSSDTTLVARAARDD